MMRYGTDNGSSGQTGMRAYAPRKTGPFFGAIDLGTNNCRLMIATGTSTGFRVVDSFNRSVRLGEGLRASGRLAEEAMRRALDALRICAQRMQQWPLSHVRAVATEACRQAVNGHEFLARVRQETGLKIDIITAREEAELAVESCSPLFREEASAFSLAERGVLFDIGGGSTEIAWVRIDRQRQTQTLIGTTSMPVGVITLQEMFGEGHGASYEEMVGHVQHYLLNFENVHRIRREVTQGNARLIGTSGTVTTLAGVAMSLPRYNRSAIDGQTLSGQVMRSAIGTLRGLNRGALASHPCVGPERVGYVLPGCAIFDAIHRLWPVHEVTIADRGLRDGMLLRMARAHGQRSRKGNVQTASRHAPPRHRGPLGDFVTI
ncbi:Ppx/GppA phosphatase family protein [Gluconobacter morbifer]|uniref:Exopolyphosphatase n=1 Tax=Gluconobacter morbifer G707 TaxID=1088869 RepID=G6XHR8_9PROT|nr:Ppx/GppA phosphatase family protein [Gluconobacter morbifer]EHH68292.1 exopolyphosphatase [Gluconobacter morbifer G707]